MRFAVGWLQAQLPCDRPKPHQRRGQPRSSLPGKPAQNNCEHAFVTTWMGNLATSMTRHQKLIPRVGKTATSSILEIIQEATSLVGRRWSAAWATRVPDGQSHLTIFGLDGPVCALSVRRTPRSVASR
eukprot:877924-Prymnesium_polylepis.1